MRAMKQPHQTGFTLIEVAVATSIFAIMSLGLLAITSTTTRLMARNLATNHSHEAVRTSGQRMMTELHDAASPFSLIAYNGTTYSTVSPVVSGDLDPLSRQTLSLRANGVACRRFSGGPYRIVSAGVVPGTSTTLSFDFGVNGALPYTPVIGDKLVIPVIKQTFDITAITVSPTTVNTQGSVSIAPSQLGYAIEPTAGSPMSAYFLRRVAYTVWNEQLRYHPNFIGGQQNAFIVVRHNITSPRPFSLLFTSPTDPVADTESLHVSLEAYDTGFSARRFLGGTTTYQTVIPPRTQPIFISNSD